MKNILILSFLLLSLITKAQRELIFLNTDSSTVYLGIANPIGFVNALTTSSQIYKDYIKGENLIVNETGEQTLVSAKHLGKGKLFLYKIVGNDTILESQKEVTIKRLPDPKIKLGNALLGDSISREAFLNAENISVALNCDLIGTENWFKILSYEFTIHNKTIKVENNLITKEIKDLVRKSNGRIKAYIESILVNLNVEGGTRRMADLSFYIY